MRDPDRARITFAQSPEPVVRALSRLSRHNGFAMTSYEPWPDPEGERPEGWPDLHWIAYGMLTNGDKLAEVREVVGRGESTIRTWREKWRAQYGPDDHPGFLKPGIITHEMRSLGQEVAATNKVIAFKARRADLADLWGSVGALAGDMALEGLLRIPEERLGDPDVLAVIVRVGELAIRNADRLDPGPVRRAAGPSPDRAGIPQGLLDAYGKAPTGRTTAVMDRVKYIQEVYAAARGEMVVEVTETDPDPEPESGK